MSGFGIKAVPITARIYGTRGKMCCGQVRRKGGGTGALHNNIDITYAD